MFPIPQILLKIRKTLGLTQNKLMVRLGTPGKRNAYATYELKEKPPKKGPVEPRETPVYFIENYKRKMGIDLLLSKELGKLIITDPSKLSPKERRELLSNADLNSSYNGIPIYNVVVHAGLNKPLHDETHHTPAFLVNGDFFKDSAFGVKVSGDSMFPEIREGDYVLCSSPIEKTAIKKGGIYLVISTEISAVKKILIDKKNPKKVILSSINPITKEQHLEVDSIIHLYKITGLIRGEKNLQLSR